MESELIPIFIHIQSTHFMVLKCVICLLFNSKCSRLIWVEQSRERNIFPNRALHISFLFSPVLPHLIPVSPSLQSQTAVQAETANPRGPGLSVGHDSLLWNWESLAYFWMRLREVWKASLALNVKNFLCSYHITVTLLVTVKAMIVQFKEYLCNAVTSSSYNFSMGFLLLT